MHTNRDILIKISMEIRMAKNLRAINESCITSAEFPFSEKTRKRIVLLYGKTTIKIPFSGGV